MSSSYGFCLLSSIYLLSSLHYPLSSILYLFRKYTLPEGVYTTVVDCNLSKDGILLIRAQTEQETRTEQARIEEAKTEVLKTEETKTEETKTEETKTEETKTEETKTEETKTEETTTEEAKTEETKTGEANTEEKKTEELKTEKTKLEQTKDAKIDKSHPTLKEGSHPPNPEEHRRGDVHDLFSSTNLL